MYSVLCYSLRLAPQKIREWHKIKKAQTWAIDSGSSGLWSLKPVYWPDDVDLLIGGLSIFFRESCLLMLVRLPCPGLRRLSGLSALRLRFWRRALGLQWVARLGEPRSTDELERGWGGCTGQWPSLLLPGRLRGGGGSDLFLCLHQQRSGYGTSCSDPPSAHGDVIAVLAELWAVLLETRYAQAYLPKYTSEWRSVGEFMSLDDDLSSVMGPLLASLSAFWLSVSEKVSSLNRTHMVRRAVSELNVTDSILALPDFNPLKKSRHIIMHWSPSMSQKIAYNPSVYWALSISSATFLWRTLSSLAKHMLNTVKQEFRAAFLQPLLFWS